MCGRFAFIFQHVDFIRQLGLRRVPAAITTRYNIAPQSDIPVILRSRKTDQIECHMLNWGFNAPAPDRVGGRPRQLHNARGESAFQKQTFAESFANRRCLIPASGFYEWNEETRAPYYVSAPEGTYLAFAGLWRAEQSADDPDQPRRVAATILTGPAAPPFDTVHHRFPVCLGTGDYDRWLNPTTPVSVLRDMMACAPPENTRIWPVSRDVGRAGAEGAHLMLPLTDGDMNATHPSQQRQNTLL